jgi:hypothetical protein
MPATPHYGGRIERLVGTQTGAVHILGEYGPFGFGQAMPRCHRARHVHPEGTRVHRGKQWVTTDINGSAICRCAAMLTPSLNWLMIEMRDAHGNLTCRNSFITDLPVNRENVGELAACGRARWKIENEAFNVLKTKSYNLEHNFGQGKRNLPTVMAVLNLLAFACHAA